MGRPRLTLRDYRARHAQVFDGLRCGRTLVEIARDVGLSPTRISEIVKRGGVERLVVLRGL
jgi:predicted transcriptional regulator